MYISRSDGMCNSDVLVQRDTLINANTLTHLAADSGMGYTEEELQKITFITNIKYDEEDVMV